MALPNNYVYPAIIREDSEEKGCYNVFFPDLPNCFTCGESLAEALEQAPYVLGDCLYMAEKDKRPIPAPTPVENVQSEAGDLCQLVAVYMPPVRRAWGQKAVKKTLTIPAYLADLADQAQVNYSQILQTALRAELQVQ